jgi:medium-chain acyl-[acyl-carrier-protein] hydrolase
MMHRIAFYQSMWFRAIHPDARLRLICFPYAGGGSAEFRRWQPHFPDEIEICPVLLPGRETRSREPVRKELEVLAQELTDAIAVLPGKIAFFGHSMGAAIAWRVACGLRDRGLPLPVHLFVAARGAPAETPPENQLHTLPDPLFLQTIQARYQGIPQEVLSSPGLLKLFLPMLKGDLQAIESWVPPEEPPLSVPITAFYGRHDAWVDPQRVAEWKHYTSQRFACTGIEGGHFFLKGPNLEFLKLLLQELQPVLSSRWIKPSKPSS